MCGNSEGWGLCRLLDGNQGDVVVRAPATEELVHILNDLVDHRRRAFRGLGAEGLVDAFFTELEAFGIEGFIDAIRVEEEAIARLHGESNVLGDALEDLSFVDAHRKTAGLEFLDGARFLGPEEGEGVPGAGEGDLG